MKCFKTRGKKGIPHPDPEDPPRCRGNKQRGHGTFANDRPPVVGVVGRETGEAVLQVVERTDQRTLMEFVLNFTMDDATIFTDEWVGYRQLPNYGRGHETVTHAPGHREWARDVDGDGIREVHNNTMEGLWTGLRNFLRPFRGVSKHFLNQYVAVFNWTYNLKAAVPGAVRALLGLSTLTAS